MPGTVACGNIDQSKIDLYEDGKKVRVFKSNGEQIDAWHWSGSIEVAKNGKPEAKIS